MSPQPTYQNAQPIHTQIISPKKELNATRSTFAMSVTNTGVNVDVVDDDDDDDDDDFKIPTINIDEYEL